MGLLTRMQGTEVPGWSPTPNQPVRVWKKNNSIPFPFWPMGVLATTPSLAPTAWLLAALYEWRKPDRTDSSAAAVVIEAADKVSLLRRHLPMIS